MNRPVVRIEELRTTFSQGGESFVSVDKISFEIGEGETLGIVGESGSGKSVTSLSLMRLIPPRQGTIEARSMQFDPEGNESADLISLPERDMRKMRGNRIAMIFQEPMTSLNPVYTCGFQVEEAIRIHKDISRKEARAQVLTLFNKVKLPRPEQLMDAYPHQLSGGQKQRVMIAMALSCQPRLLIADEPTTALDVTVQASILSLLKDLQKETGMAMIFITHDLGVVRRVADRVMVMYKGKCVESNSIGEIFESPKHPYTRGLLACRPSGNLSRSRLPVIDDFMITSDNGELMAREVVMPQAPPKPIADSDKKAELSSYQSEPLLSVKNLKVVFKAPQALFERRPDDFIAVNEVSFNAWRGETLGLVGESGCGKTSLGRAILRLIEPQSGQVIYNGTDILQLKSDEMRKLRRKMQLIFQDPYSSLNPRITAGEAIIEPMRVHSLGRNDTERRGNVITLLKRVGLSENHYHRFPHQFSGGQRQRICIARALAVEPDFIICDESVSALDVSVQAQVLNLLNELKEEKKLTYLFISHDLSVVRFMSDRIMVMKGGMIEESGTPDEIYNHPKTEYTRSLLNAIPD